MEVTNKFVEGKAAYKAGTHYSDSPYSTNPNKIDWALGWLHACILDEENGQKRFVEETSNGTK